MFFFLLSPAGSDTCCHLTVCVFTGAEEKRVKSKKEKMKERRERWLSSELMLTLNALLADTTYEESDSSF